MIYDAKLNKIVDPKTHTSGAIGFISWRRLTGELDAIEVGAMEKIAYLKIDDQGIQYVLESKS